MWFVYLQTSKLCLLGLTEEQAKKITSAVGLDEEMSTTVDMLMKLYKLAMEKDALLVEVNPYAEDVNGGCTIIMISVKRKYFFNAFKQNISTKKKCEIL